MPVTLSTLVGQSALGLTVLAGAPVLDREIRWVHASELADPTPYLEGGELLLSVGMWFEPSDHADDHALAYVRRLVAAGVAGLGFGAGVQHAEVPDTLITAAETVGLPLLRVPEQTAFVSIGRSVWEALAAEQYAELIRTSTAQQDLTRAAVASGAAGLLRRLAHRIDGWALLLDAGGAVVHAAPAGAERHSRWLAAELERFRDLATPVSATLSVEGEQIAVQSIRVGRSTWGFLAVGGQHRLTREQRTVLSTAVSLVTLILAQRHALRSAEADLRTTIMELLIEGERGMAAKLAGRLTGGLPAGPMRLLLVAGPRGARNELAERLGRGDQIGGDVPRRRSPGATAARAFHAVLDDRVAVLYPADGAARGRLLSAVAAQPQLSAGESGEVGLTDVGRAMREAEQALSAGLRSDRRVTGFAEVGAPDLLGLLEGSAASAFAQSLLRPVLEHDLSGRGDLVASLGTWLDHNGEWDSAAAGLGIHRHTLRNRIRRVAELLDRDLDVAAVRTELWVALRLLDVPAAERATRTRRSGPSRVDGAERRLVR